MERQCMLCGKSIGTKEEVSSFHVEGDCVGFECKIDAQRYFHNECLTRDDGPINEIARAQVLDYLESIQISQNKIENLKTQNLDRARKLLKEMEWRKKYPT